MMLRASIDGTGSDTTADDAQERSALLEEFVAAVVGDDPTSADRMRARVTEELGPEWLVDASAVIANFEMMTRLADATGARLRPEQLDAASDMRAERDLDRFESRRG